MKKMILLSSMCFVLFYSSVHAIGKFDLGVYGSLGKTWGFQNKDVNGDGLLNRQLNADQITVGVSMDFINVMALSKPYYGMGFGLNIGLQMYDQWFGSLKMSNAQTANFSGATTLIQIFPTMNLEISPMYRFYPTRDFSIGIGPSISFVVNKGPAKFIETIAYSNDTDGYKNYYLQGIAADGRLGFSALIDASVTKFIGNFGIYFGANIRVMFPTLALGLEGKLGFKYRFDM